MARYPLEPSKNSHDTPTPFAGCETEGLCANRALTKVGTCLHPLCFVKKNKTRPLVS